MNAKELQYGAVLLAQLCSPVAAAAAVIGRVWG